MILSIKTPETYITENGIISQAGKYISEYGKNPLVIAGHTAFAAVRAPLLKSLEESGIRHTDIELFEGYPSKRQFNLYSKKALEKEADVIIGIGGGRVLDTAKAVGDILSLPVVAIPTVGATCAAWAAVTIQYDDEGGFADFRLNKHSARLVLADPEVILKAPKRFLHSGVVDTFAKFYEIRPVNEANPGDIPFDVALYASKIALDKLLDVTFAAEKEADENHFGDNAKSVIDSIIYIAGFAGSLKTQLSQYSFAHPFYHSATRIHSTHKKLHGEIVATGIITQLVLEKKSQAEISQAIKYFATFDDLFSLSDLGLGQTEEEIIKSVDFLSKDIKEAFGTPWSSEEIKKGLLEADVIINAAKSELSGGKN